MENDIRSQTAQNDTNKPTDQALLVEYHMCQLQANTSSRRSWQSAGIILAAGLAGLTILIGGFLSGEAFMSDVELRNQLAIKIVITVFVPIMIVVLELLRKIVRREVFFQRVCYRRMREIEAKLGLRRALYVNILDKWTDRKDNPYWGILLEDERRNLESNYTEQGNGAPMPKTSVATYKLITIVQLAWVFCLFIWLYG